MSMEYICDKFLESARISKFPIVNFEDEFKKGNHHENYFACRDYLIRFAEIHDMDSLLKIEGDCWKEKVRADRLELEKRITSKACLNFALEYQGEVVGVLYTQRLRKADIKRVKSSTLENYRVEDGECIQLITLNVRLDYQDRGWGYELLEFALEYFSLHTEIEHVYAVTRCRDFLKSGKETLPEYIKARYINGKVDDPTLQFHQSHGAKVLGLIKSYRPDDYENQGYGVLIKYNIKERIWIGDRSKGERIKKENAGALLVEFISKRLNIKTTQRNKTLRELGLDSLDFTELIVYVQEKLGLNISIHQLNSKSLNDILLLCDNENADVEQETEQLPLKKRIRKIMQKYEEVVPLNLEGNGPLTFWIHPLSGDVGIYNDIAIVSDESFRIIAIKACGFLSKNKEPLTSVSDIAKYYCEIITTIQPEGPYHIAGFSFGGTIAYEIVYQLQLTGKKADTLVLVEAPYIDGKEKCLFETDTRNNLLMNANFLLLTLLRAENSSDDKDAYNPISKEETKEIPDDELLDNLVKCCKRRGLKQSAEELAFKISSMAKIHKSNLEAISGYQALPLAGSIKPKAYLFRTKNANAVSKKLWNPDYLENVQREKGSLLPLMKKWNEIFPSLKTIILNGDNHFDIFHERENIVQFYQHCHDIYTGELGKTQGLEDANQTLKTMPIAIIGMSGKFPDANNVDELWENLKSGRSSIKEFPKERGYNIDDYFDSRQKVPGKTYVKRGGFILDVDKFDPLFFKISPSEAEYMDPSERIFIEETWKAIEDAGYNPRSLSGQPWGVFCCAKGDYEEKVVLETEKAYYNPTNSFASSRISYFLNLTGPAVFSDTACSSTLTVVEEACDNLVLGNCDVAIAGGGGINSTPSMMVSSSQSLLFSPDEKCYTFDEKANGTVLGEAIAVIILKPLYKAIEDQNHIYGVIRGWGINQDGKTNGITAPSCTAQTNLQRKVYEKFQISPENITMIEAHGTGTRLGDAIEFQALMNTFSEYTEKKGFCSLGSYKPNLGHPFFGSGILGIIKILLSIKNEQIPPMLNFEKENPKIDIQNSPFYITTQLKKWERLDGKPLCGAINSFGATGTNVHMVIEEYKQDNKAVPLVNKEETNKAVFLLSARDRETLDDYVQEYINAIDKKYLEEEKLVDIAYTLQTARESMKHRLGMIIESISDLRIKLHNYKSRKFDSDNIFYGIAEDNYYSIHNDSQEGVLEVSKKVKDLENLVGLWTEGYPVDWNMLYMDEKPQIVPTPTYPFAKGSIWLKRTSEQQSVKTYQDTVKETKDDSGKESLYLFAEQWIEKEIKEEVHFEAGTVVCFVLKHENQKVLKEYFLRKNPNTKVVFFSAGQESGWVDSEHYRINRSEKDSYRRAFRDLLSKKHTISQVLYFWPYEEPALTENYRIVLHIIKALSAEKAEVSKLLLIGQYQEEIQRCFLESWIGFERSLGNMIFKTNVYTVIFEKSNFKEGIVTEKDAKKIVKEVNASSKYRSSLHCDETRYELEIQPQGINDDEVPIKRNGTYLITGGTGKLGFLFAKHLAKNYHANLVLTGRGTVEADKQEQMKETERLGGNIIYIQADVCDREQMQNVVKQAIQLFDSIDGVIYMAGTANEINILNKDEESFCKTVEPKIKGVQVLSEVLRNCSVDFICFFSSLAAILGDFGMCDYSVGNRFEMAYSAWLNRLDESNKIFQKAISIGWPLWRDGGMKLSGGNSEAYLSASGQRFLEAQEGIKLFEQMLTKSNKQYFVMAGNKKKIYDNLYLHMTAEGEQMKIQNEKLNESRRENVNSHDLRTSIEMEIKKIISDMQKISIEKLDAEMYLADYGFDSIIMFDFTRNLSNHFKIDINAASILGYPTISQLAQYLTENFLEETSIGLLQDTSAGEVIQQNTFDTGKNNVHTEFIKPKDASELTEKHDPIAIIGISGRFPQADTVSELWSKLETKSECITNIPKERWGVDAERNLAKINCKKGGFIKEIDEFDPLFFNIPPKEAKLIDPCQRIFLQEAWHTLEDAGYMGERIKGKSCGVFVGAEESQYGFMARKFGHTSIDQNALLSSRIAYALDLKGPNMTVTASCSSGLVALHQACLSLRNGDCDIALAGGVALLTSPIFYGEMEKLEMLSEDGRSYVFDSRANGLVPAEAVAVVLLKPLSKAVADKDQIYGCIKGSGVNYNGRGTGIMSPNPRREAELMECVFEKNNINAGDIQYIMTHSVGIPLGDASEIEGLKNVFRKYSKPNHCYLGTVKPIIGHTFAASGITNLIAMLMAMKNETIFGLNNFENANESINLNNTPFRINVDSVRWERNNEKPRLGAISTFANSGTNAFAVIEEYVGEKNALSVNDKNEREQIFNFQAADEQQLYEVIKQCREFIEKNEKVSLSNVAYTLQTGREELSCRMAITTNNRSELLNLLQDYLDYKDGKKAIHELGQVYMSQQASEQKKMGFPFQKYEKMILDQIIRNNDLEMLCVYWTRGNHVDWNELYSIGDNNYLVSLPGYPFKKEKYWCLASKGESVFQDNIAIHKDSENSKGVKEYILEMLSEWLGITENRIDLNKNILDYGMNSITLIKFTRKLAQKFDIVLTSKEIIQNPTVNSLSEYLADKSKIELHEDLYHIHTNEKYQDNIILDSINQYRKGEITIEDLKTTIGVKKYD